MLLFFKLCHLFIPFPFFHPFLCVLYLVYWVNFTRMSSKWGKCDACNNDYTVRTSIYWQTVRYTMNCIICNGNTCMFCVHFRSSVTMHFKFICSVKSFFPLYFSRVLHLFRVFSFLFLYLNPIIIHVPYNFTYIKVHFNQIPNGFIVQIKSNNAKMVFFSCFWHINCTHCTCTCV